MFAGVVAQLRTMDLEGSTAFRTGRAGLPLAFRCRDFCAGIGAGAAQMHARGIVLTAPLHDTPWGTREFVFRDDQGHTIHVGESR